MSPSNTIGAFSEDHASRLSGVSHAQLRRWDRQGLLKPSFASDARGPFARIYSFRDVASLRVLGVLRNELKVSLKHLSKVAGALAHLGDDKWISQRLFVLGRRVVIKGADERLEEAVSRQLVAEIPLAAVAGDLRGAITKMNLRDPAERGTVVQNRFVLQNEPVFEGTRVPVSAVQAYLRAGASEEAILEDYPVLTAADVAKANSLMKAAA